MQTPARIQLASLRKHYTSAEMRTAPRRAARRPSITIDPATRAWLRAALCDRQLIGWAAGWTVVVLLAFGLVAAIIPNPVFGRGIPPAPFAVAVWLASAPLMGLVLATYSARPAAGATQVGASTALPLESAERGSTLGTLGGLAAFVAIGCPTCNKLALLLLGASGAVSIFGPLQPAIGAASLAMLGGTLLWRLRLRARGGACARRI